MTNNKTDLTKGVHVVGSYVAESLMIKTIGNPPSEDQTMQARDAIECIRYSQDGFELRFTRVLDFVPAALFEASVSLVSTIEFEDNAGRNILKTNEAIKKWIEDNQARILNTFGVPAMASMLLSSSLGQFGFGPVITIPGTKPENQ